MPRPLPPLATDISIGLGAEAIVALVILGAIAFESSFIASLLGGIFYWQ